VLKGAFEDVNLLYIQLTIRKVHVDFHIHIHFPFSTNIIYTMASAAFPGFPGYKSKSCIFKQSKDGDIQLDILYPEAESTVPATVVLHYHGGFLVSIVSLSAAPGWKLCSYRHTRLSGIDLRLFLTGSYMHALPVTGFL
jgi:hypothetical protein